MGRIVWIPTYCRRSPPLHPPAVPPSPTVPPKHKSRCGGYDRYDRYDGYGWYGRYGYPGLFSYTEQRYPYV